jgi:hypothetical protein
MEAFDGRSQPAAADAETLAERQKKAFNWVMLSRANMFLGDLNGLRNILGEGYDVKPDSVRRHRKKECAGA